MLKNCQVSFPGARRGGRRGICLLLGFLQEKFLASLSARAKAAAKAFLLSLLLVLLRALFFSFSPADKRSVDIDIVDYGEAAEIWPPQCSILRLIEND